MPFLDVGNGNIFYQLNGEKGDLVTLVNGYTRTHRDFRAMSKFLNERGFRTLLIDNRGAGESSSRVEFGLPDMVNDILSIWDFLNIEKSHLVGISMGGVISQLLAARNPDRVSKLCLVSTAPSRIFFEENDRAWGKTEDSIYERLKAYFSPIFLENNSLLVRAMAKGMLKEFSRAKESKAFSQDRAVYDFDFNSILFEKIVADTLIIHGDKDRIVSVDGAEKLTTLIQNSKVEVFKNVGHLLLAECPKEFYKRVGDFLAAKS